MDARIAKAQLMVEQENHRPLTARDLAVAVGMSEFHFNRLYRSETGTTAASYIRTHRLRMAAVRLEWMDQSLEDVALLAGYQSLSAFSRAFKQHYGLSPLRYRRGDDLEKRRLDKGWRIAESGGPALKIVELPSRPFIRRRYLGPYSRFPDHWVHFIGTLPEPFRQPGSTYVGFIYDSPSNTDPEAIRYDCGILLPPGARLPESSTFPGLVGGNTRPGLYAVIEHNGSYREIGRTYSQLMDHWISSQSRYTFTDDPSLEIYDDPLVQQTAPETLKLTIYAPLSRGILRDR